MVIWSHRVLWILLGLPLASMAVPPPPDLPSSGRSRSAVDVRNASQVVATLQPAAPPPVQVLAPTDVPCASQCSQFVKTLTPIWARRRVALLFSSFLAQARKDQATGSGEIALQRLPVDISSCGTAGPQKALMDLLTLWAHDANINLSGTGPEDLSGLPKTLAGQRDVSRTLFSQCQTIYDRKICEQGGIDMTCAVLDMPALEGCLDSFNPGQATYLLENEQICRDQELVASLNGWLTAMTRQPKEVVEQGVKTIAAVQMWIAAVTGSSPFSVSSLDLRPYNSTIYYQYPFKFGVYAAFLGSLANNGLCPVPSFDCPPPAAGF